MSLLLDRPALGPCRVQLRPYQEEAIAAARREFAAGRKSTLMVMATGTGKTVTFGMVARKAVEKGGRVLVLAHRKELIEQAADKLDFLGLTVGVERAQSRARAMFEPDVVVATVQTLRGDRLRSWPRDHFRMVITDEAHHAPCKSYTDIYRYFQAAYHLGVTATADRADEEDLGQVFESVAFEYNLWNAMTAPAPGPYLCRLRFVQCDLQIDLRDLRTKKDDYNDAELEERIAPLAATLANAIRQEIGDRRTIVFTPGIASAQAIATALDSLGLRAEWSSGEDPERDAKIARFRSGAAQVFCNCGIATEGFDVPETSAVVLCRPTKSRALYSQMAGRGTRLAPNKPDCLLIDFDFLTVKHDLVKPVELFDSVLSDSDVTDIAAEIAKAQPGRDLVEVIEEARVENERRKVLRIQAQERRVRYRRVSYDPLSAFETLGIPWRGSKDKCAVHATQKQVEYLQKLGIEDAPNLSRSRASTLIGASKERREKGLATLKQTRWLIAYGVDPAVARSMSFGEASARLDEFFSKRRN